MYYIDNEKWTFIALLIATLVNFFFGLIIFLKSGDANGIEFIKLSGVFALLTATYYYNYSDYI